MAFYKFLIISISLLIVFNVSAKSNDEKCAGLDIYEFKTYLDENRIISVKKLQSNDLEGLFINEDGDTVKYHVGYYYGISPFLKDAVKDKGLSLGHKLMDPDESDIYIPWVDPNFVIPMLIITTTLILLILNFIWVVRILRTVKNK